MFTLKKIFNVFITIVMIKSMIKVNKHILLFIFCSLANFGINGITNNILVKNYTKMVIFIE